MDGNIAAQRVLTKLHATEASIDQAIESAAALMVEMLAAQRAVNLSATVGDAALTKITAAVAALQEARSATVAGHRRLEKMRDDMGLRTTSGIQKDFAAFEDTVVASATSAAA